MSYPWIVRHGKRLQGRRPAPRRAARIKQLRAAMLLALSGGLLWSMRPAQAIQPPLPVPVVSMVNPLTNTANNVANFGAATLANPNAATLQVNQTSNQAIIQWNSFSIGAGQTVKFQQPSASSATLNRVVGNAVSNIAGNLTANGQIYLINQNGILFATGAMVNVNTLTASTLDISDQLFKAGILTASTTNTTTLTPVFSGTGTEGDVTVQANAQLTAQSGGRIMLVAPNVHNQGIIAAPDGQIVLAAGAKVYLQASEDPSLRGLLVEVDASTCAGCTNVAENLGAGTPGGTDIGHLLAQHGNITLVGLAVNQSGHVNATTSVNANGSIELLAETNPSNVQDTTAAPTLGYLAEATRSGTVTIGAGSVTEVTPDLTDVTTAVDEQVVLPSTVTAVGNTVDVQSNSRISAPAGQVTLSATADLSNNLDPITQLLKNGTTPDGSRVYVDQGAVIDVSGTRNVVLPMSHNLVQVQLQSNELANSPLQRNGILRGQTVTVDARVGTPLADVSAAINGIGRTIAERTTGGGTVNLQSTGDVIINPGATLNVSGGSKQYQGGYLNTTQLMSNGQTYDIGSASPDLVYNGIAGAFTKTYAQWGVTESWGIVGPAAGSTAPYVAGYLEGANAGTVNINTFHLQQGGTLLGTVSVGPYQRIVGTVQSAVCNAECRAATYVPQGGQLIIGDASFADPNTTLPIARIGDVLFGNVSVVPPIGFSDNPLAAPDAIPATLLNTAFLTTGGFTSLAVYSDGLIALPQDTALSTAPGGSISLTGRQIDIAGAIQTPGGSVSLATRQVDNEVANSSHDLTVESQARINAAGLWVNDLPQGRTSATLAPIASNGGNVTLNAFGTLDLAPGSLIDVSGGAWLNSSGKLQLGTGGNVSIATTRPGSILSLGADLRGAAPGAGGTLSVTTGAVCIGALTCAGQTNPLLLDPAFFQQGGFGNYSVTANVNGLTVASGATLAPLAQNLVLSSNYALQPSGSDIYGFSTLATLPNGPRKPVNITLNSTGKGATVLGPDTGVLTVASGARISADTGAALTLQSDGRIDVEGKLAAPAGSITLSISIPPNALDPGFDPGQSIWLGADSGLLTGGVTQLVPNAFGLRQGQVLDGGTVTLNAQRGYVIAQQGSKVDVSGATGTLDLFQGNGGYQATRVASGGGTVNIAAAEGILWDGSLAAQPGAANVGGGTLNVTLTRANAGLECGNTGCSATFAHPFPTIDSSIVLQNGVATVPSGLAPGAAVAPSLDGRALLHTALINNSGFDNVTLASDRTIQFADSTALTVRGTLRLDAPQILLADGTQVNLAATYVGLGASETLYQDIVAAPGSTAGSGTLTVNASLIDLIGNVKLNGVANTQLLSRGDLRLSGVLDSANAYDALDGSLATLGNLWLQADQIYPTTFSNYTVNLPTAGSTLTLQPGHAPTAVLSAGGALAFTAPNIIDTGVLKAPFGSITLNGATLQLAAGSLTSTAADGQLIPFGSVQNGSNWTYDFGNGNSAILSAPPAKAITLHGAQVNIDSGATLNLSGGGDLFGYEWVKGTGGGSDVLLPANAPNSYAVLPALSGGAFAPFDQQYYQGSALQPGNSLYLSGGGGLAAGTYALLPARYALLPGAFLVTAVPGYQDLPSGISYALTDGATMVSGYQTLTNTGIQANQRLSGFAVQPGPGTAPSLYASAYDSYSATTYFAAAAAPAGTAVPRLPIDAGQLVVDAGSSLTLDGQLLAAPGTMTDASGTTTQTGRGAQVDIVATNLDVVNSIDPNNTSDVQLLASELNGFGAESLLLGATRDNSSGGTLINVGANTVTIGPNVTLSGPELLLAANNQVTVDSGAQLLASGSLANAAPETLIFGGDSVSGNGALLRLSVGPQATIIRNNTDATSGALEVRSNTLLSTPGALTLDATYSNQSLGTLAVTGSLSLGAPQINLGAVPANTPGLTLSNNQLASFAQVKQLVLSSYGSVDLYGMTILGSLDANNKPTLQNLSVEAAGLLGFKDAAGNDASASITAGSVTLGNPGNVAMQETATGTGTLQVHAVGAPGNGGEIDMTAGAFAVSGFNNAALTADSQIVAQGTGSLAVAGDLAMLAPRLTAQAGSDYAITAAGHALGLAAPATTPAGLTVAPNAGQLLLSADTVNLAGRIDLPAGILDVTADSGINMNGFINAAGVAQAFADQTAYLPAGTVNLSTTAGNIVINAGAGIDVAGAAQGGDAGRLSLSAAQGLAQVDPAARLTGQSTSGNQSGSFTLNESALADFSGLNTLLNGGGFTRQRTLTVGTGNVSIAAGATVTAHDFQLTVDQGSLDVAGTINAAGAAGGGITLASSGALTLENTALLDAHATATLGNGGSVTLETSPGGSLNLAGGSINVLPGYSTTTDKTDLRNPITTVTATGRSGQIYLRAPRIGINDVAINPGGGKILTTFVTSVDGATINNPYFDPNLNQATNLINITAEAYQPYTASSITTLLESSYTTASTAFMGNASTIAARLVGMTGNTDFHLIPGIEIDSGSSGNLTLANSWNLYPKDGTYNGGVAGVLTLRAAGDLNLNSSLSDGFSSAATSGTQTSGSTWSYRLVGGADLASPDPLAVLPGAGSVKIANNTVVRTGNGNIDVAAGGDITFGNQQSVLYTAGTLATLPKTNFTPPLNFNYATAGGDITLSAQNDVVGAVTSTSQLFSDWLFRQGVVSSSGKMTTQTAWGVAFANFQQNVGALGGGNINVTAGDAVTNLSAVIPTTGYLPSSASTPTVLGGGDLSVTAGGNVASGIFYVGRGTGQITAGGGLTSARNASDGSTPLYTVLAEGDASFNVQARDAVTLETVLNPTMLPQNQKGVLISNRSYFFTYAPDSSVVVQSLTGNITFDNNVAELASSTTLKTLFSGPQSRIMAVYPGTLQATAFQGDITGNNSMVLYPAPQGNLQLLAGGDVSMASINMSDADPNSQPQPLAPATFPGNNLNTAYSLGQLVSASTHAQVPVHNQPGGPDLQPAVIVADGNITGQFFLPKSVQLSAGGDIIDLNLTAQNLRSTDITRVIAGQDILYPFTYASNGSLTMDTNGIQVGGPGTLLVQAGGTIDLGTSNGVVTTANIYNPNLPAQGADVTVAAGLTTTPNYSAFMASVLDPSSLPPVTDPGYAAADKYIQQLTDYMTGYENLPTGALSAVQAYADFKALPPATQLPFLQPLARAVFIDRYLDPTVPATRYSNAAGQTQTGGKYYGTDLTNYMTAYEGVTAGTLSDAQALSDFRALPPLAQQTFMLQAFYQELRLTGREHTSNGFGYQRGFDALSALFPASNYQGDLNLYFSQIRTLAGGNINLLVPGGQVIVGLPNPPPGLTKGPGELGIVAQGSGDVSAFVKGDFEVNQSRVFTLLGGKILIWSTDGNIDAGRGAKTAITVPPPTVIINSAGDTVFNYQGAAAGSGIREILTSPDVKPGDVDLIAPNGEVNASDAGIGAAGNLNIAAQQVVGADNIQVGGIASGVPTSNSGAMAAGLTGVSNLGGDGSKLANDVTKSLGAGAQDNTLAFLTVDVLGFGDGKQDDESGDCKPGGKNCAQ